MLFSRLFPSTRHCRTIVGLGSRATYLSCSSDDPGAFGTEDIGKLYAIPNDLVELLNFMRLNLPSAYRRQFQSLRECVWLYREQTHEAFKCVHEAADLSNRPSLRLVLWGKFGTGKTITLCQLMHLAHTRGFIILSVTDAMKWNRDNYREVQMSTYKTGRIDSPWWAIRLLKAFKWQNNRSWDKLAKLKTTKNYKWSQMESTPEGRPITEIVEMGLSAPYLVTDCFGALCRELRVHASEGAIKLFITIDKANSLYGETVVKRADRGKANCDELSLNIHIRKFLMPIWSNGLCAMVADKAEISNKRDMLSIPINDPRSLFGEKAHEQIEPYVLVNTKLYTEKEFEAIHGYYLEKNWINQEPGPRGDEAKLQMRYLCAFNPYYYERLCATNWKLDGCVPIINERKMTKSASVS